MYNMYGFNPNNPYSNPTMAQNQPPQNLQYFIDYQNSLQTQLNQVNAILNQYQQPQQPTQAVQQPVTQNSPAVNPQQQALIELELMIDKIVKNNLAERSNQTQQSPIFNNLLSAIGENLSQDDQVWLSSNMEGLPDFLRTQEGKDVIDFVMESYKSYHGVKTAK